MGKEETKIARTLILFALTLCACGTTSTNTQPPVPTTTRTSDLDKVLNKSVKAAEEVNKSIPDQPAPQEPQIKDLPKQPEIKTVTLTGGPLKTDRLDLTTKEGLDAFIDLVRHDSDSSPTVTALKDITSYSHSVCWTSVNGTMLFSKCLLYRIEGSAAVVLHLQGGLDTVVGLFSGPEGEYTYTCGNDGVMRGRNCHLVNLHTGAISKQKMFLYSHPEVLVSPAGIVYLNDSIWNGGSDFHDRIYTSDGIVVASSEGPGDFTFVAEAVIEKPVFNGPTYIPGLPMEFQPRRVKAERIDLQTGSKSDVYEKE